MKKRISIDQDNVLACLTREWVNRYNNDWNDALSESDINLWNWHTLCKTECGESIYKYLDDPSLYESLDVMEGSQQVLFEISKRYELFVVSAAFNKNNIPAKSRWLLKHFDFIPEKNHCFVQNKSIICSDWLIDDKPSNLDDLRNGCRGLLFDQPHNRNENKYLRMNSWQDIRDYFNTYEQLEAYM